MLGNASIMASQPTPQPKLQIDYSVARKWKNGFEGTISVTNTGHVPVEEWQVTFDFFDVTLLDLQNAAVVAETEGIYTISPVIGTPVLLPGGTATVAFTARGNAARLPLFIDDDEDDLDDCATVVHFPGPAEVGTDVRGKDASFIGPLSGVDLMSTDGLTLDDGEVRDLLAKVDWLYFEGDAMARVQDVLGMGDRMALPRPSNENYDPLFAGSSSSSSNGSMSVPKAHPAAGGSFGTATDATSLAGAAEAGRAMLPAAALNGARPEQSVKEPRPSSPFSPGNPPFPPASLPPASLPPIPFPPVPPRDDWLL
ncbi:MAG: hypothetical protein VR70_03565 [Rhodospirillaceae bacterium BRH_c57]|nr:MAG: hypothetical protein VR70_03565 [Rhodospirillaceae bacterium BRH_c57]